MAGGLAWLSGVSPGRPISEIQFWGHGKWGRTLVRGGSFDESWLRADHPRRRLVDRIRDRLAGPEALVWLRTCETFGASAGRSFARALADRLGCRVAGHTYVIWVLQSGLHVLCPGEEPDWRRDEGLRRGTPEAPVRASISGPCAPNTVTCFRMSIPARIALPSRA